MQASVLPSAQWARTLGSSESVFSLAGWEATPCVCWGIKWDHWHRACSLPRGQLALSPSSGSRQAHTHGAGHPKGTTARGLASFLRTPLPAGWLEAIEDERAEPFVVGRPRLQSVCAVTSSGGKACTLENRKGSSRAHVAASSLRLGRNWASCAHGPGASRGDLPHPLPLSLRPPVLSLF